MINLILHFERRKINYLNNLFIILMMHSSLSKFLIYFSQQYTFIILAIIIIKNKYTYLLTLVRRTTILDYTLLETYIFCNSLQMDYALNFIRRVPAVNKNGVLEIENSYLLIIDFCIVCGMKRRIFVFIRIVTSLRLFKNR